MRSRALSCGAPAAAAGGQPVAADRATVLTLCNLPCSLVHHFKGQCKKGRIHNLKLCRKPSCPVKADMVNARPKLFKSTHTLPLWLTVSPVSPLGFLWSRQYRRICWRGTLESIPTWHAWSNPSHRGPSIPFLSQPKTSTVQGCLLSFTVRLPEGMSAQKA